MIDSSIGGSQKGDVVVRLLNEHHHSITEDDIGHLYAHPVGPRSCRRTSGGWRRGLFHGNTLNLGIGWRGCCAGARVITDGFGPFGGCVCSLPAPAAPPGTLRRFFSVTSPLCGSLNIGEALRRSIPGPFGEIDEGFLPMGLCPGCPSSAFAVNSN